MTDILAWIFPESGLNCQVFAMKVSSFAASLLVLFFLPLAAIAGLGEVKTCRASLPDQARLIFDAVLPKLKPGIDAPAVVRSTVIGLVRLGHVSRHSALADAKAAGECLRKLEQ